MAQEAGLQAGRQLRINPPRPTRAVLQRGYIRANATLGRDQRTCVRVRQAVCCYRWCRRGCLPVSHAYIDSTILGSCPLLAPSQANSTITHPSCCPPANTDSSHAPQTDPGLGLTKPPRAIFHILRHSATRPVASIATSATRHPARTARTAAVLRLAHTATRCRNRPVHHSRRLV